MSIILGVTDGDDAGAVVLVDGRLVAAVNEERLNRMKMSIGFPRLSLREALRLARVEPKDVTHVAMAALGETFHPESKPNKGWFQEASTVARVRNEISAALAKPLGGSKGARKAYRHLKRLTMGRRRAGAKRLLEAAGVRAPMSYHDHHTCHAMSAYLASGEETVLSISLDGGGDGSAASIWAIEGGRPRLLHRIDSFDSIGNFYAYVTHLCGYRASIHEGKITGLAAHGEPRYLDLFRSWIRYENGDIRNEGRLFHRAALLAMAASLPPDWEHRDLAASVQKHLEEVVVAFVEHWVRKSGLGRVCLSGGVFANVLLNQRIADLPGVEKVYVFPAMGDGGLATGSAADAYMAEARAAGKSPAFERVAHVYLGPAYSDTEIERDLRSAGFPYRRLDPIEDEIARLIHAGRVVARFDGAMEYGPRALGSRTIMYRTSDPSVNTWLNKRLNRTEFMPFAPAVLPGFEQQLFQWNPASEWSARFMTITLDCTDWMKERCPAVVHIDGTARPQIVHAETNPSFHAVLRKYHELSGVPVVVNTSFNMHEEPIVCSPDDAIRSWAQGKLDNLAIGPFLVGPTASEPAPVHAE
jgi:carbamoyltransferase